jgi:dihydroneopterin aldolase
VETEVGRGPFHLIERIAERVATSVLEGFGVRRVDVRVEKPGALRGRGVPYAAVEISREANG